MRVGVLKEAQSGETRVAATPNTVEQLLKLGYEVLVESGAGELSSFSDAAYEAAGATIGDPFAADIVFGINAPSTEQLDRLKPHATLISWLSPMLNEALVEDLAKRPITALALDAVPRISRAQSMDVLSSMANIAGYRAVIEAAHEFGRFFTGQVTAAGKVPPAKVLVAGAGVAGLAAIGAAGSLGAIVYATDPRPEVADQVKSLGGEYLNVDSGEQEVSSTGYAKEMSQDYNALAEELYAKTVPDIDILITTALIPGRPAPRLITEAMVASMRPGSVIVDMAAANGGNVAGTVAGQRTVTDNGVTILGYTDLPGRLPTQASQLYGQNLVNLMKLLTPEKDGQLVLDFDDVVQRSITVVRDGELTWPPPPVSGVGRACTGGRRCGGCRAREQTSEAADARVDQVRVDRAGRVHLLPARGDRAERAASATDRLRAGDRDRVLRDRQRSPRAAHAADVGDQRDLRDHRRRRHPADRAVHHARDDHLGCRDPAREHQHLRRFRRDPPHARHVLEELTSHDSEHRG